MCDYCLQQMMAMGWFCSCTDRLPQRRAIAEAASTVWKSQAQVGSAKLDSHTRTHLMKGGGNRPQR